MVCDSCRQRAGILVAVRSESRSADDWRCPNLKWWAALLPAVWHEIGSWTYKASFQKLLINHFAGIPDAELVKSITFVLYSITPFRSAIAVTLFGTDSSFKSPQKQCRLSFTTNGPKSSRRTRRGRISIFEQGYINRKPQRLRYFINTLLQRGVGGRPDVVTASAVLSARKTAEAVGGPRLCPTPR